MTIPINILIVEDSQDDADLVLAELRRAGYDPKWKRVQNEPDFRAEIKNLPAIVLSDYSMPHFTGLRAAEILQASGLNIPFILISGTVGEDIAVETMKKGATDYLLKDRLTRLAPAVRRALLEVEERAGRRRLEAQFIEAQKMEVIGQLAGGVAHDFNNILAVIMGYSDLMMQRIEPGDPLRKYIEEIHHASERAAGLTRQLLVFSRKQTVQLVVLNLDDVVNDMDKMLRRLVDENIAITMIPGKQTGRIKADAGYIGQVLMNLAVNARDAMPNGGELTITTSNSSLDENYASTYPGLTAGNYVMLVVSDTGTGMTDEVKAHLFEPFFTTKQTGKGTGLGLATCQTIVKQSGGHIEVHSEVDKGTIFKIYFPRVDQPVDADTQFIKAGLLPRGTETLLVVEDEPSVRQLSRLVLENQGYEVLSASNGQEGLHRAQGHKGSPIRLVITDVIMPLMGGKVMAEWLKATYPDLKILFTSGYTDDAIAKYNFSQPGMAFLSKPYTPATLARKVRAMLDNETDTTIFRKLNGTINQTLLIPHDTYEASRLTGKIDSVSGNDPAGHLNKT
jgi:two-component system cell cycle sensor histidine kinase/response regulator CckA